MQNQFIIMKKIDTNFKILSDDSCGPYEGSITWTSSNAKIVQVHAGGKRQGYEGKYMVYCGDKLVKEIPFSYTGNLKDELKKINLGGE